MLISAICPAGCATFYRSIVVTLCTALVLVLQSAVHGEHISFHRQIIPLLTRAGCNAGACHGAAAGRGGMHLSLFGSDPVEDYAAITQQFQGRRLNRVAAEKSLLLRKPLGDLDHGGGDVLASNSASYGLLRTWIEQGAQLDPPPVLERLRIDAEATDNVAEPSSATFRLRAMAKFSDQDTAVDVTQLTQFIAADSESLTIDVEQSKFVMKRPGRSVIIARYLGRIESVIVIQPFPNASRATSPESGNFIDRAINQRLSDLRFESGASATDADFIRRVTLDLTGRLATPEQVLHYINDSAQDKKERLIARLLSSSDFIDYWTLIYSRWLHLHSLPNEPAAMEAMASWIRQSIAEGVSWKQMSRQLLTATGDSHTNGPANLCRMVGDARAHAELVGEVFLGVRLACANCHDHPLDRWTQDDYHGLAALLARIDRGRQVQLTSRGEVTHPKTYSPARGRLPGDRFVTSQEDPLQTLADWFTEPSHERIAAPFVNRVWSQMFGRGLVEPVDDHRLTNPPTHPELLQELTERVVAHDYDLRSLLRWIANSETYARESRDQNDDLYAFHRSRPLEPHVLVDAISDVTEVPLKFERRPHGTRAVQMIDPLEPSPELDVLGRCRIASGCNSQPGTAGLASRLSLINGDYLNSALTTIDGQLVRRLDSGHSTREIVEWFYLYALGKNPSQEEIEYWCQELDATDREQRLERIQDWLWSILCSRQFQRNH
jgi:hypothetical protein